MKKIYILLPIILLGLLVQSCASLALIYFKDKAIVRSEKCYSDSLNKSVIFFPMLHVGSSKHYAQMKIVLDSLKADGYVVYYEGLGAYAPETQADSLAFDTMQRKERVILRQYVSDYTDKENKTNKPIFQNSGLVMQNSDSMGLNTPNDIWVDYMKSDLIKKFEEKYGEIKLAQYDFDTPLNSVYTPHIAITYSQRQDYVEDLRNELILNKILTSDHQKIAAVYGHAHYLRIRNALVYKNNFKCDEKYNGQKLLNQIKKRDRQAERELKKI